jgi:hypothetical protein
VLPGDVCESPQINNLYLFIFSTLLPRRLETENFTNGLQAAILLYYIVQNRYSNNYGLFVHLALLI